MLRDDMNKALDRLTGRMLALFVGVVPVIGSVIAVVTAIS
jgi:hypothetical protein